MKTFSINVKKRTELGKKSTKALRAEEQVPCVMYGGEEIIHFYAHANEFRKLIYTNQVYLVELNIDGKIYKAVIKDMQFHPIDEMVMHMDFIEVIDNKAVIVNIPIELTGASVGILAGGKLRLRRRYLKAKGLAKDMPEFLAIDITKIEIGSVIKVSDLSFDNLELLDPAQSMVVGVVSSRLAKGMDDGAIEGAEEGTEEGTEEGGEATKETASEE
jgi:large subunit ribosomal protein L25